MKKLDCLGDFCPIPVIKAKKAFNDLQEDESLMLVTDHSCVVESITNQFGRFDCHIESEEVMNGIWEITITRLT